MKKSKLIAAFVMLMLCMSITSIPAFANAPYDPDATQYTSDTASENQSSIPNYPNADGQEGSNEGTNSAPEGDPPPTIEAVPVPSNPLTPPGTGTVVDSATDRDGKEFFTIVTEDGNIFFLIIDHRRSANNVYFLSTVTEEDLLSLAQQGGIPGGDSDIISAVPPIEQPEPETPILPEMPEEPEPEQPASGSNRLIPILVVVAGVGGAAYYFKIVKGKRDDADDELYDDEDEDDDSEDEGLEDDYDYEPDEDDSE